MKNKKRGMSKGKMLAVGAGIAAASAGAYYFLGPKGKEHQRKAKVFLGKMEREVKSAAKQAKNASKPIYHKAVDMIADTYSREYKMHEKEIQALAKKLKDQYKGAMRKAKSSAKRVSLKTKKRG